MQDQPDLVGDQALAGGPGRSELALVHLDQVLRLPSGALYIFVELPELACQRGDDLATSLYPTPETHATIATPKADPTGIIRVNRSAQITRSALFVAEY